ncbi:CheR family methyltransferase [Novipirellula artificiosorum]|uniref:Chemotaxis protein methyltransferase Cher2 n=1 Tax=Novipirellula artificiosorum TaxID=2528016 RepID=A0A5C6DAV6_9BACT|nr:protein-glutamate O-methyltransferase CheR [Novipirellula artificiosorum]TWU34293.1 Chemotaxis protein methyltransferase Cher2 [Novipirellula artificiosorum]
MTSMLTDRDLELVLQTVQRLTGIRFRSDQTDAIRATILRVMDRVEVRSPVQFARLIEHDQQIYHELVEEITVGETYFFREPKHFEFVRRRVIPELRMRRGDQTMLHAWSAACASGEEAYSLAIVCEETHQPASILGTDISREAIANAREATYRRWSFRGEAMSHVGPYVTQCDNDCLRLNPLIRKRVQFAQLNLASDGYPSGASRTQNLDLIFCRNVLIYFDASTNAAIADRLFRCLRPGGWLVTASGDPILSDMADFVPTMTEFGSFYQRRLTLLPDMKSAKADPSAAPRLTNKAKREPPPPPQPASSTPRGSDSIVRQIQALSRSDQEAALEVCSTAVEKNPLVAELHFLQAKLLLTTGSPTGAFLAVQRALFLDRSAIMVHFLCGSIQHKRGQLDAARKHFFNARELCQRIPPDQMVPYSDRATATQIIADVNACLARIDQ